MLTVTNYSDRNMGKAIAEIKVRMNLQHGNEIVSAAKSGVSEVVALKSLKGVCPQIRKRSTRSK